MNIKKEPIFLSPIVTNNPINDSIISFYNFAIENEINVIGYPSGAIINIQSFESDKSLLVKHYYFKMRDEQNSYKPEGKYVVFYGRCAYGESTNFYEKLFTYIKENNLRICGDAFEEYPLNEFTTKNEKHYCVKIEVMVEDIWYSRSFSKQYIQIKYIDKKYYIYDIKKCFSHIA